jgi:hypothetical protein
MLGRVEASVAAVSAAAVKSRPVAMADTRLMSVPGPLVDLFPDGGIRRGSTVVIGSASGGVSLALTLAAPVTSSGAWAAAVGLPYLGLVAAAEMGVCLERLALVPHPGEQWSVAAAALLDGVDLLLLQPTGRARPAEARRLAARARERGVVLVVMGSAAWPESPDIKLDITGWEWRGLGTGFGHLQTRRADVEVGGRRAASRSRRCRVWLPGDDGRLESGSRKRALMS